MIGDIKTNKVDYSILAIISALYMLVFIVNQSNNLIIFQTTVIYAILYIIWGIFHHYRLKNLKLKIMLEYLLVATFGIVVASTLLI